MKYVVSIYAPFAVNTFIMQGATDDVVIDFFSIGKVPCFSLEVAVGLSKGDEGLCELCFELCSEALVRGINFYFFECLIAFSLCGKGVEVLVIMVGEGYDDGINLVVAVVISIFSRSKTLFSYFSIENASFCF